MPENPPRREDDQPQDDPLIGLARSAGALVNFVRDAAAQIVAAGQAHAPAPRLLDTYRSTFQPSANPSFTTGFQTHGAEQRLDLAGREPLVDLFDEGEEIVLVVEWPDGDAEQIEVSVQDDVLALAFGASAPAVDMLLPALVDPSSLRRQTRNGIVEIRLRRT